MRTIFRKFPRALQQQGLYFLARRLVLAALALADFALPPNLKMADGTKTDSKLVQQMVQAEVRKFLAKNPQQAKGTPPSKGAQKAPKPAARKWKGKVGHTDPKTGLAAPLHYGPKHKNRKGQAAGKNKGKGKQPESSKQSK
ncbi:unnamed protein product [Rhizoctonia solani]|uniref:Uncharacterized protein n=1 Tax=Rhizoctonia solani TaxID=456999 RepID=A0A8H2WCP3_9AGAM|nr:unnamed protein product [Rhizoctonia solani]